MLRSGRHGGVAALNKDRSDRLKFVRSENARSPQLLEGIV
jgi:hypothetical protein